MTYSVQFFAGRNYVFFFDLPDFSGPDYKTRPEDVTRTIKSIAELILEESPDFILLQEVDDGASRTENKDQLFELIKHLGGNYPYHTSTFYWKAFFVPHPRILGSVGLKLSILSKFVITEAARYDLPRLPANIFVRPFLARRTILSASIQGEEGKNFSILNTHLDAFAMGTNVMEMQVECMDNVLKSLIDRKISWVIGGDFNLLPNGQYLLLPDDQKPYYNPNTEIKKLYECYKTIPSLAQLEADLPKWFTFFGNDPSLKSPARTLDYLLYSEELRIVNSWVPLDQVREPRAQRRLPARQANLLYPGAYKHPRQARDLLERGDRVRGQPFHLLVGEAVHTAEVAHIRNGDAEAFNGPAETVAQRLHLDLFRRGMARTWH